MQYTTLGSNDIPNNVHFLEGLGTTRPDLIATSLVEEVFLYANEEDNGNHSDYLKISTYNQWSISSEMSM